MVNLLGSGSEGPGSRPVQVIVLCSCEKQWYMLTVPLSTQVDKWGLANC